MSKIPRTFWVRTVLAWLGILIITVMLLIACDDDADPKKRQSDEQAQLRAQLETERAIRLRAEESARSAEESRTRWLVGTAAAGGIACILAVLFGIHVGVRGAVRACQERPRE